MNDLFKRRGKITVTRELLFSGNLKFLKEFFGNFYPVDAHWDNSYGFSRDIVYIGFSEQFDIVEEWVMAPEYSAEILTDSEDNYTIKFIR